MHRVIRETEGFMIAGRPSPQHSPYGSVKISGPFDVLKSALVGGHKYPKTFCSTNISHDDGCCVEHEGNLVSKAVD